VLINKKLASFRISYLCHRAPGLRWMGNLISPQLHFKWIRGVATVTYYSYPADWRRIRYLRRAMKATFPTDTLRTVAKKNIVYRQWHKALTYGWPSWAGRCHEWVGVQGEEHLREALREGKGVVLLSGHAYGFTSMVAPVLGQKGYRLHRTGRGHWGDPAERWGRDWSLENWEYNSFGQDFWQHVRALNKMHLATKKNEIIHLLVTGSPQGDPKLEIEFYHKRFFLDPATFRVIETLQAPVLPCFPVCDDSGHLVIMLHRPLPPSTEEIMDVFGPLYSRYLRERPEFAIFWRKIVQQKGGW